MISIDENIIKSLIYPNKNNIIYADYTGTGQCSPLIDDYLKEHIYPYYANTHSNSYNSKIMTENIDKTRKLIREKLNVLDNQAIIFTGNGSTGTINHLVSSIDFKKYSKQNINIIISLYEHHSNYLPWLEKTKIYSNIKIYIIPLTDVGEIDYEWYSNLLMKLDLNDFNITSITACSNVSGIITDIIKIKNIINQYLKNCLLFVDYACLAPYKKIDASLSDACFISPHKFIGGISTPGLLIASNDLFMNKCPYNPGGGCVIMADDKQVLYDDNIEVRETGGTPNIIGIIRIRLILMIKEHFQDTITKNEEFMVTYIHNKLIKLSSRVNNLTVLYLNKSLDKRLPIICISLNDCPYNDIVKIMTNLFGIQTRGGVSCCGIFARYINNKMKINGWCRISFHWLMTMYEINYILNAIEYISINHKQLSKYKY